MHFVLQAVTNQKTMCIFDLSASFCKALCCLVFLNLQSRRRLPSFDDDVVILSDSPEPDKPRTSIFHTSGALARDEVQCFSCRKLLDTVTSRYPNMISRYQKSGVV